MRELRSNCQEGKRTGKVVIILDTSETVFVEQAKGVSSTHLDTLLLFTSLLQIVHLVLSKQIGAHGGNEIWRDWGEKQDE